MFRMSLHNRGHIFIVGRVEKFMKNAFFTFFDMFLKFCCVYSVVCITNHAISSLHSFNATEGAIIIKRYSIVFLCV